MKRCAFLVAVLLSLATAGSKAQNQQQGFVFDTGIVTLGSNQLLRLTVSSWYYDFSYAIRRSTYAQGPCNDGICKHSLVSQDTSNPIHVAPNEGASVDIANSGLAVRGTVLSSRRRMQVTAQIIDTTTGNVTAAWDLDNDGQ
jgi:hypothetical protein